MLSYAALFINRVVSQHRPIFLAASVIFDCGAFGCRNPTVRYLKRPNRLRTQRQITPRSLGWAHSENFPSTFTCRPSLTLRYRLAALSTGYGLQNKRTFTTTRTCNGAPLVAAVVAMLKSSSTLGAIQWVGRLLLSVFPMMWAKTRFLAFRAHLIDLDTHPQLGAKQAKYLLKSKRLQIWTAALLAIPFGLIGLTALASSERTPLTGRWRVILLSPAEEEAIASDLRGHKWHAAVRDIMAQSSATGQPPALLSPQDWRLKWVEQTLRRLERAILILHNVDGYRDAYEHHLQSRDSSTVLYPPPPKYPLLPRGRATSLLHEMPTHTDLDHEKHPADHNATHHIAPHTLLGPPYSFTVVQRDESNAFSYGFGPGGAGGVVVFSGFLDDIMRTSSSPPPEESPPSPQSSWSLFGSVPSPPPSPPIPTPTPEQTSKLATLLAHELSHLVLSHHIETLSKGTILFPSIISMAADTVRSILYPITFITGPFFGDALDRTLRMGFDDLAKAGEACANTGLEIEADVISARILALAGFDPQLAVSFWEDRMECESESKRRSARDDHPICKERIDAFKAEIASWETARNDTLRRLQSQRAVAPA